MSSLSESQRGEIIGLYKNNVPNHKITKIVGQSWREELENAQKI